MKIQKNFFVFPGENDFLVKVTLDQFLSCTNKWCGIRNELENSFNDAPGFESVSRPFTPDINPDPGKTILIRDPAWSVTIKSVVISKYEQLFF